jgi:hypothetical protein
MELAEAQQTKPTFKMPVLEVEEELMHNPPSADLTSRPSVVSWFSPLYVKRGLLTRSLLPIH